VTRRRTFASGKAFAVAVLIAIAGIIAVSIIGHAMHRDIAACEDRHVPCGFP
jgi:hypothetical protein